MSLLSIFSLKKRKILNNKMNFFFLADEDGQNTPILQKKFVKFGHG